MTKRGFGSASRAAPSAGRRELDFSATPAWSWGTWATPQPCPPSNGPYARVRTWCGATPPGLSAACRGRRRPVRYKRRSEGRRSRGCGRRLPRRWGCSRLRAPKRTAAASGTAAARALGPAVLWRPRLGPSSGLRTLRPRPRATPWAPTGPPPALRPPAARPSGVETTPSALHSRSPPPASPS